MVETQDTDGPAAGADGDGAVADDGGQDHGESDPPQGSIDPSELTIEARSLHPRIRTIWIVRSVLTGLFLGVVLAAGLYQFLDVPIALAAASVVVPVVLLFPLPIVRYRVWSYEIREDAIYLERGVFTRVQTVVPYVRIQHIDTSRGPIERATGLATLVVYTAGSRGADVTIPGLAVEDAEDHQRRLKRLAIAAEDDTAV